VGHAACMTNSRRRLPHWVPDSVPVFVTWRLAGTWPGRVSLPQGPQTTAGEQFALVDDGWDRFTAGPVWLRDARVAQMVVDALLYGASVRELYDLHAYVVMPNHVDVVWEPKMAMPRVLQWVKGVTARRAKRLLGLQVIELRKVVRYVERNPVKAGLSDCVESWPWSSASARQTARPSAPPAV